MFSTTSKDDIAVNLKLSATDAKNDLSAVANQAGRKVRSIITTAGDEISDASDKVTTEIRNNPVRSTMIALGVGVVLGALLRR